MWCTMYILIPCSPALYPQLRFIPKCCPVSANCNVSIGFLSISLKPFRFAFSKCTKESMQTDDPQCMILSSRIKNPYLQKPFRFASSLHFLSFFLLHLLPPMKAMLLKSMPIIRTGLKILETLNKT